MEITYSEDKVELKRPRMRDETGGIAPDRLIFYSTGTFSEIEHDKLLKEVKRTETELSKRKASSGVQWLGCGDNKLGIIDGGSTEHIVEHAICAVLDNHAPLDEQSTGNTMMAGASFSPVRRDHYSISVSPPPSIDMEDAQKIMELVVQKIISTKGNLDLLTL